MCSKIKTLEKISKEYKGGRKVEGRAKSGCAPQGVMKFFGLKQKAYSSVQ